MDLGKNKQIVSTLTLYVLKKITLNCVTKKKIPLIVFFFFFDEGRIPLIVLWWRTSLIFFRLINILAVTLKSWSIKLQMSFVTMICLSLCATVLTNILLFSVCSIYGYIFWSLVIICLMSTYYEPYTYLKKSHKNNVELMMMKTDSLKSNIWIH